jgi:flavin-dependent dehydrogenase
MAAAGEKARVVLVGGGPAGSLFAKTMEGHADVVLLDP